MYFCIPYQSEVPKGISSAKCVNYRSFLMPCSHDHEGKLAGFTFPDWLTDCPLQKWISSGDNSLQGWLCSEEIPPSAPGFHPTLRPPVSLRLVPALEAHTLFFPSCSLAPTIGSQNTAKVHAYLCYHQYIMLLLKDMECDVGRAGDGCLLKPE